MLLALLVSLRTTTLPPVRQGESGGLLPSRGSAPARSPSDLRPLLAMGDQATMLSPERERWAIAVVTSVGASREQAYPDGGRWDVFDVDLRVLDGWNVAKGDLRAFWNEDDSHGRIPILRRMIGSRVLIRLAPIENGRFLVVGGADEKPDVGPTFAVGDRALLSLLLPTTATELDGGTPAERRFRAVWRAGASLPVSAYPLFERYVGAATPPITSRSSVVEVRDPKGWLIDEGRVPGADVIWLRRFARDVSPPFQMLVEENLRRNQVQGWNGIMRGLIERALRDPDRFPDGVFAGVVSPEAPHTITPGVPWPSVERLVEVVARRPSAALTIDLLSLMEKKAPEAPGRARLLFLLSDPDELVRWRALQVFDHWQGEVPKGADRVAWHTVRAKMSLKELEAAKAATGA